MTNGWMVWQKKKNKKKSQDQDQRELGFTLGPVCGEYNRCFLYQISHSFTSWWRNSGLPYKYQIRVERATTPQENHRAPLIGPAPAASVAPPPPGCLRSVPATTQAPAAGPRSQLCAQPHLQTPLSPVSVRNSWTCRHSRHFLRALRGHVVTAECNTATLTQDHTAVEAMDRGHLSPRDIIPHWAQSRHAPALGALHSS